MNILILHRIPYHKIDYQRGIDHSVHHVVYLGTQEALKTIPDDLPCVKIARLGKNSVYFEAQQCLAPLALSFDRIISLSEYELLDAARLRQLFNVPGPSVDAVLKVRDKLLMKECVGNAGLHVPRNCSLEKLLNGNAKFDDAKLVLKPIDGASSENVCIFDSTKELLHCINTNSSSIALLNAGGYKGFEVEEFISGEILHFDGLVESGKVKVLVASQYIGTCLAYAQGKPLGSFQIDITPESKQWVLDVLRATDLTNGSFHLEAIVNNGSLVFLEVANRVGGADVVNVVELATGVHLPSAELKIYLSESPLLKVVYSPSKFGWFVFPGHHLKSEYCHVEFSERFKHAPQVVRWNELKENIPVPRNITYQAHEVPLAGLVQSQNSEALQAFIQNIFERVEVKGCDLNTCTNNA